MRGLKVLTVVTAGCLGALFAIGFLLDALFEVQGFGGPRDQPPRMSHLIESAIGFAACVIVPAHLARRLLHAGPTALMAAAIAVAGWLVILGLSLAALLLTR